MTSHPYLDRGLTIFQTRLQPTATRPGGPVRPAVHPFITISREACAGATTLGQHLIPLLNTSVRREGRSWMFLDKDLLTHALTKHHLPEHMAEFLPEDRVSEIQAMIGELTGLHPPIWELENRVTEAIRQFAHLGFVILAGRAAHLITRELPGGLHLRLVASMAARRHRLMAQQDCTEAAAEAMLRKLDEARRRYVQTNFDQDINDPHTYDLVINTDRIAPTTAAQLVFQALHDRLAPETGP